MGRRQAVILAANILGAQVLTLAIPLGMLFVVCFWGFFQRHANR